MFVPWKEHHSGETQLQTLLALLRDAAGSESKSLKDYGIKAETIYQEPAEFEPIVPRSTRVVVFGSEWVFGEHGSLIGVRQWFDPEVMKMVEELDRENTKKKATR